MSQVWVYLDTHSTFSTRAARGKRDLKNTALDYLMHGNINKDQHDATSLCLEQYRSTPNMTDKYDSPTFAASKSYDS